MEAHAVNSRPYFKAKMYTCVCVCVCAKSSGFSITSCGKTRTNFFWANPICVMGSWEGFFSIENLSLTIPCSEKWKRLLPEVLSWDCWGQGPGRMKAQWDQWPLLPERLQDLLPPLTPHWQLMSSWVPATRSVASCALRCRLNRVSSGTNCTAPALNHSVPAFAPPASSGWRFPSASPKPSREVGGPTGLAVKKWKLERDFLAVLCRWLCHPCWFSLVPACVHPAHAFVQECDRACR